MNMKKYLEIVTDSRRTRAFSTEQIGRMSGWTPRRSIGPCVASRALESRRMFVRFGVNSAR